MAKVVTISLVHRNRTIKFTNTVANLASNVFRGTLESGHSFNNRINLHPKTAKSLLKALNHSASLCGRCYDYYVLEG